MPFPIDGRDDDRIVRNIASVITTITFRIIGVWRQFVILFILDVG